MRTIREDWSKDRYYFWYSEKQAQRQADCAAFMPNVIMHFRGKEYTECRQVGKGWSNWDDAVLVGTGCLDEVYEAGYPPVDGDPKWYALLGSGINLTPIRCRSRRYGSTAEWIKEIKKWLEKDNKDAGDLYREWYKEAEKKAMDDLKFDIERVNYFYRFGEWPEAEKPDYEKKYNNLIDVLNKSISVHKYMLDNCFLSPDKKSEYTTIIKLCKNLLGYEKA